MVKLKLSNVNIETEAIEVRKGKGGKSKGGKDRTVYLLTAGIPFVLK